MMIFFVLLGRFPAQEAVGGDSKIPTELYYDAGGNVRAVGAEAIRDGVEELATEEVWEKAEWYEEGKGCPSTPPPHYLAC